MVEDPITPATLVPFLGTAYSRACEYTCDAYGAYLWPQGAEGGILVLAAGKRLYREMDVDAFLAQAHEQDSFWMWLAEHLATHPNLPKRLSYVRYLNSIRAAASRPGAERAGRRPHDVARGTAARISAAGPTARGTRLRALPYSYKA